MISTGDVYGLGKNTNGLLGVAGGKPAEEPTKILDLCGKSLKEVAVGENHTMALLEDGKVLCWGRGGCGQLGVGTEKGRRYKPVQLSSFKASKIAAGANHSLGISLENSLVYAWGTNELNECGSGDGSKHFLEPRLVNLPGRKVPIIDIACGENHSLALDVDGKVYSWGCNSNGELGVGDTKLKKKTMTVRFDSNDSHVVKVGCGRRQSAALTKGGELYLWGDNANGILGVSSESPVVTRPLLVEIPGLLDFCSIWRYEMTVAKTEEAIIKWGRTPDDFVIRSAVPVEVGDMGEVFAGCWSPCILIDTNYRVADAESVPTAADYSQLTSRRTSFARNINIAGHFNNKEFSDLTIEADGKKLYAHKMLLHQICPKFCEEHDLTNPDVRTIKLSEYSYDTVKDFVYFLYSKTFPEFQNEREQCEMAAISLKYNCTDLYEYCRESLKALLTVQKVVPFLNHVRELKMQDLEKQCAIFILKNLGTIAAMEDQYKLIDSQWLKQQMVEMFAQGKLMIEFK